MKKKIIKSSMISVATAVVLSMTGCGGNGSSSDDGSSSSNNTNGTVADGYIKTATVCFDENNNNKCDVGEPFAMTDDKGYYSLTISAGDRKAHPNASIIVKGGIDIDTDSNLTGSFKAPVASGNVNITPLTTLVAAMVEKGIPTDTAYSKVAKVLDLTPDEIKADPVELANNGNKKVIAKAMAVHRIVTTMAKASNIDNSDVYVSLVPAISQVADSNDTNISIVNVVTKAADNNPTLKAAQVASVIEKTVETAVNKKSSVKDAALISDYAIKNNIQSVIEANGTVDTENLQTIENNITTAVDDASTKLISMAIENIFNSYNVSFTKDNISSIASNFDSLDDVTPESIIESSDINSSIKDALSSAYTIQKIKSYVGANHQLITDDIAKKIASIDGIDYKSLDTMSLADFSQMLYSSNDTDLMSLSLTLNPPEGIASESDITKAKNMLESVRTQVNKAQDFTKDESTKINKALNNIAGNVEFTSKAINTLNDMISEAIDTNTTELSRIVDGGDRNLTVSKDDIDNNTVWKYSIKDTNVTTPWEGKLTYPKVLDSSDFNPSDFTTLSEKITGQLPLDYYGATIPEGKINSQDISANITIDKKDTGANFNLTAKIVNNGDSVSIKDANVFIAYDTNKTTDDENNTHYQPNLKYVEIKNLYVNGVVGNYNLDGKIDVSYAINKIAAKKGFYTYTKYNWISVTIECDGDKTDLNTSAIGFKAPDGTVYKLAPWQQGPTPQYNEVSNTTYIWVGFDNIKGDLNESYIFDAENYVGLESCENINFTDDRYYGSWTDDDFENSGHFYSEITFDGKLTNNNNSSSLEAIIDAKWLDVVDANTADENYEPNLDVSVKGILQMPESPAMNVSLNYLNTGKDRNINVTYINGETSIKAYTKFNDVDKITTVNIFSSSGVQAKINFNDDGVDYASSSVTNESGDKVGTIEDFSGTPRIKFADGSFETLY
jgi:hypothetical protein